MCLMEMNPNPTSYSTLTYQRALMLMVAGLVIALDQLSKQLIEAFLPLYRSWAPAPILVPNLRLSHVSNTGSAFGLFPANSAVFAWAAFIVSLAIVYYNYKLPPGEKWLRLALGLQLGGALGNLIDRLRLGHVTDFVDFGPWVFNLADASIVLGALILAGLMWRATKRYAPAPAQEPSLNTLTILDEPPSS